MELDKYAKKWTVSPTIEIERSHRKSFALLALGRIVENAMSGDATALSWLEEHGLVTIPKWDDKALD